MKSGTVKFEVDVENSAALTAEQRAETEAIAARLESAIDYSEISPVDDSFWKSAMRNPYYKPTKTSTTVRIDSDVLAAYAKTTDSTDESEPFLTWVKKKGLCHQPPCD